MNEKFKKKPSQRQLRVGEEIRHILSEVFSRQHSKNDLLDRSFITITEVRVSPDFHNATVYIVPLGGNQLPEILDALKIKSGYFRHELAQKLTTRLTPRLVFQADHSFDEAQRIDTLLNLPRVKKDIEKG